MLYSSAVGKKMGEYVIQERMEKTCTAWLYGENVRYRFYAGFESVDGHI